MNQICSECLYGTFHPFGITLDKNGLCSGCIVHREKYEIDWSEREVALRKLLQDYQSKDNYDCIVPVSGSGDSFFIVHTIKNVMGMNPLLVTYNNHFNTAVGIRNLARLKTIFDCDLFSFTLSPSTVKKISRETILRLGSIYWHSIAGQTVFPVRLAHKLKIPLIIWGAHQGLDQVGMFSHYDYVEMSRKYRHEHDLMGLEAEELIDGYENITESDIEQLRYPEDEEIASVGIRGIYLNNYLFWDARTQHEKMIKMYGYESMTQTRTFDIYSYASCWNYSDLHDYIKLLKCGYGRVVDDATRELRLGRMNKMDAMRQVEKYLFKLPLNKSMYFDWLGVTESAFDYLFDQFRNVIYWRQEENLEWRYVGPFEENNYMLETQTESTFRDFSPTPKGLSTDLENKYIIIGKGVS